jgi:hydrogenase maturation protein HypF
MSQMRKGIERKKIHITGVVQGVGFRPFIYQLAHTHHLKGWVLNASDGVWIEVEGERERVKKFTEEIPTKAPPRARIENIDITDLPPFGYEAFEIRKSEEEKEKFILVSPDIATCELCVKELFDKKDRRYQYPFINCTNCGPRFTIIEDIPYDRPKTTMKKFPMCPDCEREYHDPLNRRFHAQPNACPICGPSLFLIKKRTHPPGKESGKFKKYGIEEEERNWKEVQGDPIEKAIEALREGKIVAIKGLGGFHLACDATNNEAVKLLRKRKRRPGKPFAIMVKDVETVKEICEVSLEEESLLNSPECPIVLLKKRRGIPIAFEVAPYNNYLGVMIPYTPLHHLILKKSQMFLIMTSGNISEEPIASENKEALRRLGNLADLFLLHDRDIYSRYDDSVVRIFEGKPMLIRRARGYAPYPIHLPYKSQEILAVGPELKNTFCLTKENYAFISQHIGDMENEETFEHFQKTIELYKRLFRIKPQVVAYDLHPEYLSTKFAQELELPKVGVQHHHAHIVGAMIENKHLDPVIGFSFDGTGFGTDGKIWGGEVIFSQLKDFERLAHLKYIPLPGGEASIKKPWRMALSYLIFAFGKEWENLPIDFPHRIPKKEAKIVEQQIEKGINSPLTSSCGRLFDAVSSLIGVRDVAHYEAQAAIEMEMISNETEDYYHFQINKNEVPYVINTVEIVKQIVEDLIKGVSQREIAGKFHQTMVKIILELAHLLSKEKGVKTLALAGGVFQNFELLKRCVPTLRKNGFKVLLKRNIPVNDGGVSLGQAAVAHFKLS